MRKPAFCICENKDADQLRGNREADQRLCFSLHRYYNPSSILIRNFKPLAIFCGRTAQFVSGLVRNPKDRFSHNEAYFTQPQLYRLHLWYYYISYVGDKLRLHTLRADMDSDYW